VPPSFDEYRLPPGRHRIPVEQIHAIQRWRLVGACAGVLEERGYLATTVAAVTREAAVSKAAFYRNFDGLPHCILETYRVATGSLLARLAELCGQTSSEDDPLSEVADAVSEFLATEPALAHVITDAALGDVSGLPEVRAAFTNRCAALLAAARREHLQDEDGSFRRVRHLVWGAQGLLARDCPDASRETELAELARLLGL
jgi:AcrR family transcriptional regulator